MTIAVVILVYVVLQRLVELFIANRNTKTLLARGGHEVGEGHYPMLVALHVSWLVSVATWVWVMNPPVNMQVLAAYGVLQLFRFWVMASLGEYWTTRIITVPDAPLVRRGPYRVFKHPNYMVVVLEIAILPLIFGAWYLAAVYSVVNALVLMVRIRVENEALQARS